MDNGVGGLGFPNPPLASASGLVRCSSASPFGRFLNHHWVGGLPPPAPPPVRRSSASPFGRLLNHHWAGGLPPPRTPPAGRPSAGGKFLERFADFGVRKSGAHVDYDPNAPAWSRIGFWARARPLTATLPTNAPDPCSPIYIYRYILAGGVLVVSGRETPPDIYFD